MIILSCRTSVRGAQISGSRRSAPAPGGCLNRDPLGQLICIARRANHQWISAYCTVKYQALK
jgi:hypothetical protein